MANLLAQNGFRVKGKRADCPFCSGGSRLTVSFDEHKGIAHCFRCQWTASTRSLARQQGIELPQRAIPKTWVRKEEFRKWLLKIMGEMANRERRVRNLAEWAKVALKEFPDMESAWTVLADWYHSERAFNLFWETVSDRTGRFLLYRDWRRKHGAK